MNIVTIVLVLLLAVVLSEFGARLLPWRMPLPFLQIAVGAVLFRAGFQLRLDSHLFLLLFIPPLLFLDGWRMPKGAFFREWKPILSLAIGLVVFTVIGVGFFVHWLIPSMPLAVAFALAAIVSPTDPVAVKAMTTGTPLPARLTQILEGEALLNDASGLVCFSFAVTAALTGAFSPAEALASFAVVAGGGVVVGLAVTWLIARLNRALVRRTSEEPAIQMLVSLLIPFAAYLAAEHLGFSGILAAAVAGIGIHYAELSGRPSAATRMLRTAVWDTVQAALNGTIFVLLGLQLPRIWRTLPDAVAYIDAHGTWQVLAYGALITLALTAMRWTWAWVSMRLTIWHAGQHGEPAQGAARRRPRARLTAVMAAAGVRGAITLAGILTLPETMPDGSPFPAREVAIPLAMAVILFSLLVAGIAMPLAAHGLEDLQPAEGVGSEAGARQAAIQAAIQRLEAIQARAPQDEADAALRNEAASRLLASYRERLQYGDVGSAEATHAHGLARVERELRLQALTAGRDEIYRMRRKDEIDDQVHRELVREIDLLEASLLRATLH